MRGSENVFFTLSFLSLSQSLFYSQSPLSHSHLLDSRQLPPLSILPSFWSIHTCAHLRLRSFAQRAVCISRHVGGEEIKQRRAQLQRHGVAFMADNAVEVLPRQLDDLNESPSRLVAGKQLASGGLVGYYLPPNQAYLECQMYGT